MRSSSCRELLALIAMPSMWMIAGASISIGHFILGCDEGFAQNLALAGVQL